MRIQNSVLLVMVIALLVTLFLPLIAIGDDSLETSAIRPGITMQLMFEYYEEDQGEDVHPEYTSEIKWRRIRPTLRGYIMDGDLQFYFQGNTTPGSIELLDSYVNYTVAPVLQVRAGQYKIPFTRYRINSFKNLLAADWPICTSYFGAERQIGLTIHNGFEKPRAIEYELGIFTGQNARKSHGVGLAKISGEALENPSDLVEPAPMDEFHPALALHLAYHYNDIVPNYTTDFEKTGFRFSLGGSGVWDANPTAYRDFSMRLAPELMMKAYGIGLTGTYYMGYYEPESEMNQTNLGMTGAVVGASYLIGSQLEISARYSYVGTTDKLREDAGDRSVNILKAVIADPMIEKETLDELIGQYADAGNLRSKRETVIGLNFYMLGRNLKLQNDISFLQHIDYQEEVLNDLRFRSQLQFTY